MLVGEAPDHPLALQRIEAVEGGLIGGNLASGLDFPDERRAVVLVEVSEQKFEYGLLFLCQNAGGQVVTGVCDMDINRIEILLSLIEGVKRISGELKRA